MPLHLHVILDTYFLHQSLGFHYISKIAMSINLYAKWHIEVSIKILLKPECHAHMVSEKKWEVKQNEIKFTKRGLSASAWRQHCAASLSLPFSIYALAKFDHASQKLGRSCRQVSKIEINEPPKLDADIQGHGECNIWARYIKIYIIQKISD